MANGGQRAPAGIVGEVTIIGTAAAAAGWLSAVVEQAAAGTIWAAGPGPAPFVSSGLVLGAVLLKRVLHDRGIWPT